MRGPADVPRFRLLVLAVLVAAGCAPHPPDRYQPATPGAPFSELTLSRNGEEIGAADPDVIRVGDSWYLYATTSDEGFEAWSSTDLLTWDYEGLVWQPTPGSWNDRGAYWAPDIHEAADGFYLYYTAGNQIGVARSATPVGPFIDLLDHPLVGGGYGGVGDGRYWGSPDRPVPLLDSDEHAIDAFLFEASDGSLTLYFSTYPTLGIAVIAAIAMVDEHTPLPGPATVVLPARVDSWELFIREAPWVTERDGTYHLTYSGAGADTTCYAIGEATSTDPLGPFERTAPAPMLHDDPAVGFYGPGHHSLTEGADGRPVMLFHTKNHYEPGFERRLRWAQVTTDASGRLAIDGPAPGSSATGSSSCAVG